MSAMILASIKGLCKQNALLSKNIADEKIMKSFINQVIDQQLDLIDTFFSRMNSFKIMDALHF